MSRVICSGFFNSVLSHDVFSLPSFSLLFIGLLSSSLDGFIRGRLCLSLVNLFSLLNSSSRLLLNSFRLFFGLLVLLVRLLSYACFILRLLLACKVRIQKYHAIVHNLQVLSQQTKVAIELTEQSVNVRNINLYDEGFSTFLMLGLDYEVAMKN